MMIINTNDINNNLDRNGVTFTPHIKNKVDKDEKFTMVFNDILNAINTCIPDVVFTPSTTERKFSDKEINEILARTPARDTRKQIAGVSNKNHSVTAFNDYISNHTKLPVGIPPETYIGIRNSIPMRFIPQTIEMDKMYSSLSAMVTALIEDINSLTDVSVSSDNIVTSYTYIPYGFYTDFDGGEISSRNKTRHYVFSDSKSVVSKKRYDEIHIVPRHVGAMNWLNNLASHKDDLNGCDIAINEIATIDGWESSRFLSVIVENSVKKYNSLNHYGLNTAGESSVNYIRYTAII